MRSVGSKVAIFGGRLTGKTTLLKHLMPRDMYTVAMGPSVDTELHAQVSRDAFDPQALDDLVERQKQGGDAALLVIDDCLSKETKECAASYSMRAIALNGKCLRITVLVTSQYPSDLPPEFRTSLDYVYIAGDGNRRRMWECYGGVFPTFVEFSKALDDLPEHTWLVIDNASHSTKIEDVVSLYRI